ncbi:hypothetical protein P3T25_003165 [Paraburkholderia sp. GAS32]
MKLSAAQVESRQIGAFEIAIGEMERLSIARHARANEALHIGARECGVGHHMSLRARSARR